MEKWELPPRVQQALERGAVALWIAAIVFLLFATLKTQLARAAEFPAEIGAGALLFQSANGFDAAAPLATDVRISVAGVAARVALTQRFRHTA